MIVTLVSWYLQASWLVASMWTYHEAIMASKTMSMMQMFKRFWWYMLVWPVVFLKVIGGHVRGAARFSGMSYTHNINTNFVLRDILNDD